MPPSETRTTARNSIVERSQSAIRKSSLRGESVLRLGKAISIAQAMRILGDSPTFSSLSDNSCGWAAFCASQAVF